MMKSIHILVGLACLVAVSSASAAVTVTAGSIKATGKLTFGPVSVALDTSNLLFKHDQVKKFKDIKKIKEDVCELLGSEECDALLQEIKDCAKKALKKGGSGMSHEDFVDAAQLCAGDLWVRDCLAEGNSEASRKERLELVQACSATALRKTDWVPLGSVPNPMDLAPSVPNSVKQILLSLQEDGGDILSKTQSVEKGAEAYVKELKTQAQSMPQSELFMSDKAAALQKAVLEAMKAADEALISGTRRNQNEMQINANTNAIGNGQKTTGLTTFTVKGEFGNATDELGMAGDQKDDEEPKPTDNTLGVLRFIAKERAAALQRNIAITSLNAQVLEQKTIDNLIAGGIVSHESTETGG